MAEQYIVIPNWRSFQHYRDRTPTWIKTYVELLSDDNYLGLTGHQRAVLHGLWLEYASSRCHLRLTTSSLSARLGLRVMSRDIEALNHAGFIELSASPVLAAAEHPARPEKEVREERSLTSKEPVRARTTITCPRCDLDCTTEPKLRDHLDNVHWLEGEELDQAVAEALRG